jgi:hypothetical protein
MAREVLGQVAEERPATAVHSAAGATAVLGGTKIALLGAASLAPWN